MDPNALKDTAAMSAAFDAEASALMGEGDQPVVAAVAPAESAAVSQPEAGTAGQAVGPRSDASPAPGAVSPPVGSGAAVDKDQVAKDAIEFLRKEGRLPAEQPVEPTELDELAQFQEMFDSVQVPQSVLDQGFEATNSYRNMMVTRQMVSEGMAPMQQVFAQAGAQAEAQVVGGALAGEFGKPEAAKEVEAALLTKFGDKLPGVLAAYRAGTSPQVAAIVRDTAELAVMKSRAAKVTLKPDSPQPADAEPMGGGGGAMAGAPMDDESKALMEAMAGEIGKRGTADDVKGYVRKVSGR